MADGFNADPQELHNAAGRISEVVGSVQSDQMAQSGNGVDFGNDGVHKAYTDFCVGLDKGIKVMVDLIESMGESLRQTADSYRADDEDGRVDIGKAGDSGGRG